MPPPDTVVGRHGPRAPGRCQRRVGFGDSLPVRPPCISDGVAAFDCSMGAGDNLVRDATGGVHSQPATKQDSGLKPEAVMLENIKLGSDLQPKPSVLPGSLLVASSTVHLLRLPVQVYRACGGSVFGELLLLG